MMYILADNNSINYLSIMVCRLESHTETSWIWMCKISTNTRRFYHRFSACFTSSSKVGNKYYDYCIRSGLLYFHLSESPDQILWTYALYSFQVLYCNLLKSPEQIPWPLYSFRVALLSFIRMFETNIMVIIFVPDCLNFTFIY